MRYVIVLILLVIHQIQMQYFKNFNVFMTNIKEGRSINDELH